MYDGQHPIVTHLNASLEAIRPLLALEVSVHSSMMASGLVFSTSLLVQTVRPASHDEEPVCELTWDDLPITVGWEAEPKTYRISYVCDEDCLRPHLLHHETVAKAVNLVLRVAEVTTEDEDAHYLFN